MDIQEQHERRERVNTQLHAVRDYGWGAYYAVVGGFLLLHKQFGVPREFLMRPLEIGLGVVACVYGAWRIVRGIQKKY